MATTHISPKVLNAHFGKLAANLRKSLRTGKPPRIPRNKQIEAYLAQRKS